ncbi:MFS transporter [Dactylosporangium vinaceum]|uniref:MFS transporter n=1 Tax=Dactylosporangium vinaceum TaxID=53362 RepID=A0ABV5M8L0_9ACTN|nr:MFS transporter [Dactylosporangium vinaceum]UAB94597.1 MFS transporter [Dactylosporangium vinaceum]
MSSSVVDPPAHPRRWAALAVLSLTLVAVTLDNSVLNTALPSLAHALKASTSDLQWITDAYTLVFASALILAGTLGARLGSRTALLGGLAVFGGGSAIAALSGSPGQLIAWRAVMGLGAAFVMPATLAIIVRIFPAHERPKAFGAWSAAAGIGVLVGPVTGGALLEHFAWSSAFWINVPLVAFAIAAVLALVPPVPAVRGGRLDLLGALLSTAAVAALVDAVIQAPARGWADTVTLGEFGLALVLVAAFVWWQRRSAAPLVRLDLFANRTFAVAALSLAVVFFVLFGTLFELSQYLQLVHGYSPLVAGLGAMPFAVAMATTSATSPLISRRLGTRGTLALGLFLATAGLLVLAATGVHTEFWQVAIGTGIIGLGMGMMMAPASLQISGSVPARFASMASALNSVIRELGGVLGIAVLGTVVSSAYRSAVGTDLGPAGTDLPTAHGFAATLPAAQAQHVIAVADQAFTDAMSRGSLIAAGLALVMAVTVLLVRPRLTVAEVPAVRRPELQTA